MQEASPSGDTSNWEDQELIQQRAESLSRKEEVFLRSEDAVLKGLEEARKAILLESQTASLDRMLAGETTTPTPQVGTTSEDASLQSSSSTKTASNNPEVEGAAKPPVADGAVDASATVAVPPEVSTEKPASTTANLRQ